MFHTALEAMADDAAVVEDVLAVPAWANGLIDVLDTGISVPSKSIGVPPWALGLDIPRTLVRRVGDHPWALGSDLMLETTSPYPAMPSLTRFHDAGRKVTNLHSSPITPAISAQGRATGTTDQRGSHDRNSSQGKLETTSPYPAMPSLTRFHDAGRKVTNLHSSPTTPAMRAQGRATGTTGTTDRRGSHDRNSSQVKRGHHQIAWEHLQTVTGENGYAFSNPCGSECAFKRLCLRHFTSQQLVRAHEYSFGVGVERRSLPDGSWAYSGGHTSKETHDRWNQLACDAIMEPCNPSDAQNGLCKKYEEHFAVDGKGPVCARFWAAAYGLPESARNSCLADARSGRGQADAEWQSHVGLHSISQTEEISSEKEATITWWMIWLDMEDQMPNEATIVHRRVVWQAVYDEEYVVDMEWSEERPLSRTRWLQLRIDALAQLSIEYFGEKEDGPGVPNVTLELKQRANHSNFSSCNECDAANAAWKALREDRHMHTVSELKRLRASIFQHQLLMKRERRALAQLFQEARGTTHIHAQYDDKCGSIFCQLPSPEGGRESGQMASRYKYRTSLQGNLFVGALHRISVVPPNLQTGANFGCSAHLGGLYEMSSRGKLGSEGLRCTDSGPDNDALVTHCYHWCLIHFGVLQKLTWIRLKAKHSHNLADRVNSMIKETIWPRSGADRGGVQAPWDLEDVVSKALKTQKGWPQLAWQMANMDFKTWFKGRYDRHFAQFSHFRYWEYEYDATLVSHGYVRVRYRDNILPFEEKSYPELKPFDVLDTGQMIMKQVGYRFMLPDRYPSLEEPPPLEPWKAAENGEFGDEPCAADGPDPKSGPLNMKGSRPKTRAWQQEKVLSDITKHRMLEFPPDKRDQWRTIKQFHETHKTSDTCPKIPCMLPRPQDAETQQEFALKYGMPMQWKTIWGQLAWRFPRPHQPTGQAEVQHQLVEVTLQRGVACAQSGALHSSAPHMGKLPLAQQVLLINGTTGVDTSNAEFERAKESLEVLGQIEKLCQKPPEVKVGELRWVILQHFEGEFRVGLARIKDLLTAGGAQTNSASCSVEWCIYKKHTKKASPSNFYWCKSPTFVPYLLSNGKVNVTEEVLTDVLPIPVRLTAASQYDPAKSIKSLKNAKQLIRVKHEAVQMLHLYCTSKDTSLHRTAEAAGMLSEDDGGGLPLEQAEEDEVSEKDEEDEEDGEGEEGEENEEVEKGEAVALPEGVDTVSTCLVTGHRSSIPPAVTDATVGQCILALLQEHDELRGATVTCISAGQGYEWCKTHKSTLEEMMKLIEEGSEGSLTSAVLRAKKALFARRDMQSIVVEQGSQVLAFITYGTEDRLDDCELPLCLYTYELHVRRELDGLKMWSRGIGRALMRDAEVSARVLGCRVAALTVYSANSRAKRMYTFMGYKFNRCNVQPAHSETWEKLLVNVSASETRISSQQLVLETKAAARISSLPLALKTEAVTLCRANLELAYKAASTSLEDVGLSNLRFFPDKVQMHLLDRTYAHCAQLKAMAAVKGVDIAVVDSSSLSDACSLYTANCQRAVQDIGVSWQSTLVPRYQRQQAGERKQDELPLVIIVWNGVNHFDAAVPRVTGPCCVLPVCSKRQLGIGGRNHGRACQVDLVMLHTAGLELLKVPGDGACAYWSVLATIEDLPRTFFTSSCWPLSERSTADTEACRKMRDLRAEVVAWLLDAAQLKLMSAEPDLSLRFGDFAAEHLGSCSRLLRDALRAEANIPIGPAGDVIRHDEAISMLEKCKLLQRGAEQSR